MKYVAGDFVVLWPSDPSKIPQIKRMVMPPYPGWRRAVLHSSTTALPVCIVEMLNPHRRFDIDLSKIAAMPLEGQPWFGAESASR